MSGFVGGDPQEMTEGSRALHRTGGRIEDAGGALRDISGSSAGHEVLSTAIRRLGAAVGTAVEDTGTQTKIAAALADAAAQDIHAVAGS
ncbi:hypothetical protein [Serinicoccus marinus]|uniref:hypothetical protein n=1 Tax=Serinicoccus marinus TaxID=247333 RepID=UPI0003B5A9F2|nr:hypothetical protein [Serinicoccus marinus]